MEWTVNCFNNLRGLGQVKLFRILYFFVGIRQALKKKFFVLFKNTYASAYSSDTGKSTVKTFQHSSALYLVIQTHDVHMFLDSWVACTVAM